MISRRILQRGAQVRLFHTKPIARGGGHGSGLHFEPGPTTDEFGRLGNIPVCNILFFKYLRSRKNRKVKNGNQRMERLQRFWECFLECLHSLWVSCTNLTTSYARGECR